MDVFVSNLNFKVTSEQLEGLFMAYGKVEKCNVVFDKQTRKSKGFGFVTMSEEDAKKAITGLNEKEYQGRNLMVRESVKKETV